MKKYDEFIKEDFEDDPTNFAPYGMQEYHKALLTFLEIVGKKLRDKVEKEHDDFGEYINNVNWMPPSSVAQVLHRQNEAAPIKLFIDTLPPSDMDDFISFFERVKKSLDVNNYMDVEHYDKRMVVTVNIPLKWIDENLLKSYSGITKYDL